MMMAAAGVKADTCDKNVAAGEDNACGAIIDNLGYDNAASALSYLQTAGGTYTLLQSLTPAAPYTFEKDTTIDAGDFLLRVNTMTVKEGATLTLKGSNIVINQTAITVEEGAKLVIDGAKITATADGFVETNGTVEVKAGSVIDSTGHTAIMARANSVVTLNGTIKAAVVATSDAAPLYGQAGAKVTVDGGEYTSTGDAFVAVNDMVLVVNNGKITATPEGNANAIFVKNAKVTVNGGELVAGGNTISVPTGFKNTVLTVNGGTVASLGSNKYALYLANATAKYVITGGTFESQDPEDAAAMFLTTDFFDAKTGDILAKYKGILTGGKYLNNIIALTVNKNGATVDLSEDLVAKGYAIKVEDPYKLVVSTTPVDPEPEQTPDPAEPNPNTLDNVSSVVAMGGVSLAVAAFGIISLRKREN